MSSHYPQIQAEDAQRRRAAEVERQHDQRIRWEREMLNRWRTLQERRQSADAARRLQQEQERRRS